MAICTAQDLLDPCLSCLTAGQRQLILTQLLYDFAGSTDTPQELLTKASCYLCLMPGQLEFIKTQLLCEIFGG